MILITLLLKCYQAYNSVVEVVVQTVVGIILY